MKMPLLTVNNYTTAIKVCVTGVISWEFQLHLLHKKINAEYMKNLTFDLNRLILAGTN